MSAGRRRWLSSATACLVLATGLGLAGCSREGSDTQATQDTPASEASQATDTASPSPTSETPKTPPTSTPGRMPTVADYIKQNNITETVIKRGTPNAPVITLPALPGWLDAGPGTPPTAYGAMIDTDPAFASDPPSIVVIMSKLDGADPAEVLKLAPNEVRNLPDFDGKEAQPGKLANFDAAQISGTYTRNGQTRLIAQKTVVVPGKDGLYVIQINADGTKEQAPQLGRATAAIDRIATITP